MRSDATAVMRPYVMNGTPSIPPYLTHYYHQRPFRTLTELSPEERERVIRKLRYPKRAAHRLHSAFYFEQRLKYERIMYDQFVAKGGKPQRRCPHYAVLGESELWAGFSRHSLRIPLAAISPSQLSFTYTDSWAAYVDQDLEGNPIPRKLQYGTPFRLDELDALFRQFGWPGNRWKTEPAWAHDVYVEAQIWSDDHQVTQLCEGLLSAPSAGRNELRARPAGPMRRRKTGHSDIPNIGGQQAAGDGGRILSRSPSPPDDGANR